MFTQKLINRGIFGLGSAAIALLATFSFSGEANAQEAIRSNIAPRPVRSNLVPAMIRSNMLPVLVRSNLLVIADQLGTTVDELLEDPTIAEIALSPAGADVLNALSATGGITGAPGNFEVTDVITVETPQGATAPVQETLDILEEN